MDRKQLAKLRADVELARRSPQKSGSLESLAAKVGRTEYPGGNHVMWKTDHFPHHRPFPIPRHGNKEVGRYPQKVILDGLEEDLDAWEMQFDSADAAQGRDDDGQI